MSFFEASEGPRIFGLPPGIDFATVLADGIDARLAGQPPDASARVVIWVNTRRAQRALATVFAARGARLLPRIRVVTELADDALEGDRAPRVPELRRRLELARLVGRLAMAEGEPASENSAWDMADSLADLLDEMQGAALPLDAFAAVDAGQHAAHWQRSLRFLTLIADYAAATGPSGSQARIRAAAESLAARWAASPPAHPVIVAGSTGSRPATRTFMAAVARLPQGALVLPGHDLLLPRSVWDRLGEGQAGAADHPQHGFRRLADALGFDPAQVRPWHPVAPPAPERNALVSLALRPAPVTDQWRAEGGSLAPALAAAAQRLTWIEAPDQKREALAIARASARGRRDRHARRPDHTRPDARAPRDGRTRPLGPHPGRQRRTAAGADPARHPAPAGRGPRRRPAHPGRLAGRPEAPAGRRCRGGRGDHLRLVARLERKKLRGGPPWVRWQELTAFCEAEGGGAPAWLAWMRAALEPLAAAGRAPLAEHVARHEASAEALAGGPGGGAHGLWHKAAGLEARALLAALAQEADAGGIVSAHEYLALFQSLLSARDVREEAVVAHPALAIWGTLEARVQAADRVILGGLNEGVWPRLPGADPWLDRGLRRGLGLPSPEAQVGLSAHDFQQAAGAPRGGAPRATRDAEAPTVPRAGCSGWKTCWRPAARGAGRTRGRQRARRRLARARRPGRGAGRAGARPPAPGAAPAGCGAAGGTLGLGRSTALVRDPYAVYARSVLRLRRLDPPGAKPTPLTRGNAIHAALDDFVSATPRRARGPTLSDRSARSPPGL